MEIKNKVLSNLLWRFAERCGAQLVQFVVSVVLARILLPEEFGTVAMVLVIANIFQVFVDSGLANALIQKKDADDLDFSSVFFFNIVWCIFLYSIIFVCSPMIAEFYNDSSLITIIRVLCLTVVISGVKNVQQAYVSRTLQFRMFFFSTLAGTVASAIAGITLAILGYGVWALVWQKLINLFIDTIVLWITVKWRPKRLFSFTRLKVLLSYGWKLLISALIDTIYNNLWQLVIGKVYTESDLAYYNQGKQIPNLIVSNINTSIDSVLLPAMSKEQYNKNRVREMTRRSIKTSIYIMAPLMMGLVSVAPSLVQIVLTDKWLECVPFLRIFCITYMFYPIHTANLNAIKALGRSDLFLKLELSKKLIGICLLLITVHYGIMAMAYSLLISSFTSQIINSWPNRKLLNYSYIDQLKDIMPSILLAIVMGIGVNLMELIPLQVIVKICLQVIVGVIFYLLGSIFTHNDSFMYLSEIIKPIVIKISEKHDRRKY